MSEFYTKIGNNLSTLERLDAESLFNWNGTSWINVIALAAGHSGCCTDHTPDDDDRIIATRILEKALLIVVDNADKDYSRTSTSYDWESILDVAKKVISWKGKPISMESLSGLIKHKSR